MAAKTQLSPTATPGMRYSFSAKTEAEEVAIMLPGGLILLGAGGFISYCISLFLFLLMILTFILLEI